MLDEPLLEDTGLPACEVLLLAAVIDVDLRPLAQVALDKGFLVIQVLLLFLHVSVLVKFIRDVAGVLLDHALLATPEQRARFWYRTLKK